MAAYDTMNSNCIKNGAYLEDWGAIAYPNRPPRIPAGNLIKWYNVKMTLEEKARFNLLTYEEYFEWLKELEEKQKGEEKTFWAKDTEERTNVSRDEYDAFLAANNVDVSNRTSIDFDSLARAVTGDMPAMPEQAEAVAEEEPDMDAILASVNAANHGGDKILSQEEIEALFAAAAGN